MWPFLLIRLRIFPEMLSNVVMTSRLGSLILCKMFTRETESIKLGSTEIVKFLYSRDVRIVIYRHLVVASVLNPNPFFCFGRLEADPDSEDP